MNEIVKQVIFGAIIFAVLVILIKVLLCDNRNPENFAIDGKETINLNVNIDKYVPDHYDHKYGYGYGCATPYCRKRFWYNRYTPFPWNNPTRLTNWYYPPYTYWTDYFRNYYGYPTYY